MKIHAKMDPQNDPQIDIWALMGQIFEILGGFLRSRIFDGFLIGEKSAKIRKSCGFGRPKGRLEDFGGRVGGRGGGQQRLLESDRNWQESAESIPNALLPARGAADLKAKASCRRPPKI